jgi:TetR/AcrR family transcriptional regulator, fatty acid metabolism regulator protein
VKDKQRTFTETARRTQIIEAAIDTIAEVGFARASLARIGERIGTSKGLIGYHFAGRDDLIKEVVSEIVERGMAYMQPRIIAEMSNGSGFLRAYIESNLAFMRDHRNYMVAIVEIRRGIIANGLEHINADMDEAVQVLAQHLARYQSYGQLRSDFDPQVMAVAVRAVIDAVPPRLAHNPDLDVESYAREIANLFHLATGLDARA